MTQAAVKVDISGAVAKLRALDVGMKPSALVRTVGLAQQAWVNQNFKDEGTEEKWQALSENTKAARRGKGYLAKPLQDTGTLRRSFVTEYSENEARTGSVMPLAFWHHAGTKPYDIMAKPNGTWIKSRKTRFGPLAFQVAKGYNVYTGFTKGWAFATKVRHPGLPARPLVPSAKAGLALAERVLKAYLDKLAETISALRGAGQ